VAETSQYECKTCDKRFTEQCLISETKERHKRILPIMGYEGETHHFISPRCGMCCHSSFENEREKTIVELRKVVCELYDDGFKNPLVTFDAAVHKMKTGSTKFRIKVGE